MHDLLQTDHRKGPLIEKASDWILEITEFRNWYGAETQLLWIKGDHGKGKTMMATTVIDELSYRL